MVELGLDVFEGVVLNLSCFFFGDFGFTGNFIFIWFWNGRRLYMEIVFIFIFIYVVRV